MSCNNNAEKDAQIAAQRSLDSMKTEMVKRQAIDSMNAIATQPAMVNNEQPVNVSSQAPVRRHTTTHSNYTSNTTNTTTTTNNTTAAAPAVVAAEPKKKKGWSAKAKGAVIGTGVGAITGAMVDKKKGEGAVVGGLMGAAAGFGAGALIDKSNKNK